MLLDLYQALMSVGFPIPSYHYLGFGSIFFVDFRIVHKLLRIKKMTSVEGFKGLWKRCEFNKPFESVNIFEGMSSDLIPGLSKDELHLAWLDYDFPLNKIVASDIVGLTSTLRPWSIVMFTIDLERPKELPDELPASFLKFFQDQLPEYAVSGLTAADFKPTVRDRTIVKMIERCVKRGIRGRIDLTFEYLIRLHYADGHKMLTVGGMIADQSARENLSKSTLDQLWFLSRDQEGESIGIPKLVFTPKEVCALEQAYPDGVMPKGLGISNEDFDAFNLFYRYWPSYTETLV